MRIVVGLGLMAALCATAASARPAKLTDVAYMQAARCAGLADSGKFSGADAASLTALLKDQSQGRMDYVLQKADDLRRDAKRQADRADDYMKAKLSAEVSGPCAQIKG